MLARRLAGIPPPLAFLEVLDATNLYSITGLLTAGVALCSRIEPVTGPR